MRIIITLVLLGLLSYERPVYGCECVGKSLTAWGELQSVDAVFEGEVIKVSRIKVPVGMNGTFTYELKVRFKILRALKGVNESEVAVRTGIGGGDCGFGFKVNEKYLVYAHRRQNLLSTDGCTRTKLLVNAAKDFEEIDAGVEIKIPEQELP